MLHVCVVWGNLKCCVSVTMVVGFLYILLSVFVMVKSRKFILLLTSVSKVKFNYGCSLLMYWCS
jgi:hypothetical protein